MIEDRIDFEAMAAAWEQDKARDRAMTNEALAGEVAAIAQDGRPIYATLLALLNRIRPRTDLVDIEQRIAWMILGPQATSQGDLPDLENLQIARWDGATQDERAAAATAAQAIVATIVRPLLGFQPSAGKEAEADVSPESVEPAWVTMLFRVDGTIPTVIAAGHVRITAVGSADTIPEALRPISLRAMCVTGDSVGSGQVAGALRAVMRGADRRRRPVEIIVSPDARHTDLYDLSVRECTALMVRGYECLGFHGADELSGSEIAPDAVAMRYLPEEIAYPIDARHRAYARTALGLDGEIPTQTIRRNGILLKCGRSAYARMMEMRTRGYAKKTEDIGGRAFFWLTQEGYAWAVEPGEHRIWDVLPDEAVI